MFHNNLIYSSTKEFNVAEITICAEIRHLIQSWRKDNKLPIDFVIPSVYVYFRNPVIKSALVNGRSEANSKDHLFKLCQIDKVFFKNPLEWFSFVDTTKQPYIDIFKPDWLKYDFYIWSPLGGSIGYGNVIQDNPKDILNTVSKTYFTQYF